MPASRPTAEQLERQSVVLVECTIPAELTIDEWRRQRRPRATPAESCDHLHDSTSRYDHKRKQLTFLLVCPECRTEKVVDSIHYEPHFTPHAPAESAGATVHQLPVRRHSQPLRRAA
jgi:hypothetical protein